jgi:serine protease Do
MKKIVLGFLMVVLLSHLVSAQEVVIIKKNGMDTADKPLMIIDGKITNNANINDISPNDIKSINVLKGEMAKKKYGDKGNKGVIEITMKSKVSSLNDQDIVVENIDSSIDKNVNLSIVIDGDKITINGKPADKNDPRLKMMGKRRIKVQPEKEAQEIERSDDVIDFIGPEAAPTNAAFLGVMSEANDKGAKINSVSDDSPAQKAGLRKDDIISKVNEKVVDGPKALYEAIGAFKPADKVTITYIREGKIANTSAVLAKNKASNAPKAFIYKMPNDQMPNNFRRGFKFGPGQDFNFEMPELNDLDALSNKMDKKPKLGISIEDLENSEGVKIKSVTAGSAAEKAGLKVNDIITHLDTKKVADVSDLKWDYLQEGQVLKFSILRGTEKKNIEVKIPKKLKTANL